MTQQEILDRLNYIESYLKDPHGIHQIKLQLSRDKMNELVTYFTKLTEAQKLLLTSDEFDKERDNLLENYESPPDDLMDDVDTIVNGTFQPNPPGVAAITEHAKTHLVPSEKFVTTWNERLAKMPEAGGDSEEYNQWAIAAGVHYGEDFMYGLDIGPWTQYYEFKNKHND